MRHWGDKRTINDAPEWMTTEEANAWTAGYNAAIKEYDVYFKAIVERHTGWPLT